MMSSITGDAQRDATAAPPPALRTWDMSFSGHIHEIVPGLYLGNIGASHSKKLLGEAHINAIVSLTDVRWARWSINTREAGISEARHKWIQCTDTPTQDLLKHLGEICDFIDEMASPLLQLSQAVPGKNGLIVKPNTWSPQGILVHCEMGLSRSPTAIVAYLMRKYGASLANVLAFVNRKRNVQPSPNFMHQLRIWETMEYQIWENEQDAVPKAQYKSFLEAQAVLLAENGAR